MPKDTLLVVLSDMHSGSSRALFPNRVVDFKSNGNSHHPNNQQELIYQHWKETGKKIKELRKNKTVVLVHNGDAIEGIHHGTREIAGAANHDEQTSLHVELMEDFKKMIDWQRGDKLYYVTGTETHVLDKESEIAKLAGAQQYDDDLYSCNLLEMTLSGHKVWFVHHGPGAGTGANEGNQMRNWLKGIYFEALKYNKIPPSIVITGHVHQPTYDNFVANDEGTYKLVHGVICPSWQAKTRYANQKAPVAVNKIGAVTFEIKADGEIKTPAFHVMESESITKVSV